MQLFDAAFFTANTYYFSICVLMSLTELLSRLGSEEREVVLIRVGQVIFGGARTHPGRDRVISEDRDRAVKGGKPTEKYVANDPTGLKFLKYFEC